MRTKWIIIGAILLVVIITSIMFLQGNTMSNSELVPTPTSTQVNTSTVSPEEQRMIDTWIQEKDLNEFGDPKESMYAGGTPLFDEATGETKDRYEYIVTKFPDRPWNK